MRTKSGPIVSVGRSSAVGSVPSTATRRRRFMAGAERLNREAEETRTPARRLGGSMSQEQTDALAMFRRVGEIRHAITSRARLVSGARMLIGVPSDLIHEDGVPARDPEGNVLDGLRPDLVEDAEKILAEIVDALGTQSGLIEAISALWDTIGECYMVAWWEDVNHRPVSEDDRGKFRVRWEVVGPAAYTSDMNAPVVVLGDRPEDKIALPKDHQVFRLWLRDVERPNRAWSWLMSALPIAAAVDSLTREQLAGALASALGKIFLVPSEAAPIGRVNDGDHASAEVRRLTPDEYAQSIDSIIGDALQSIIEDDRSGAGVMAAVLAVPGDHIDKFGNSIDIGRTPDPQIAATLEMSLRRLRESADVSPEMLAGLGDTNRWNGVQVTEEEFKRYHRPLLASIAAAWTSELLYPSLVGLGKYSPAEIQSIRVIVDPSPIIADPDPHALANDAFDRGAIGFRGYRSLRSIDEALAPTPEERDEIRAWISARRGGSAEVPATPANEAAKPEVNTDVGSARKIAAASAGLPDAAAIAAIEDELVSALVAAGSQAVEHALSRAQSVLRNRGRRARFTVPDGPIPAPLAREISSAVFADDDEANTELLAAAIALLKGPHDTLFDDAVAGMFDVWGMPVPTAETPTVRSHWTDATITLDEIESARESSWSVLSAGLVTWSARRLYNDVSDTIEQMAARLKVIPRTLVRRAMAAAGGTRATTGPEGIRPRNGGIDVTRPGDGSLGFGPRFSTISPPAREWTWHYGDPGTRFRSFEPHRKLDGLTVSSPDDEALDSPEWGGYWPGDHAGCQCALIPAYDER